MEPTGETIRIMLGDCLQRMAEIEDGSVSLIASDLPYQVTACRWDTLIPFKPLWAHYRRILKPRGAVVLTACQPFTSMLVMSNPEWFRYTWVMEKDNGANAMNAPRQPIKIHEDIVVFSGSPCGNGAVSPMVYNPQELTRIKKARRDQDGGETDRHRPGRREVARRSWVQEWTDYPRSIIYAPGDGSTAHRVHPTQKPVALMEYLIRTYSNQGDLVHDSTMGSGTTGVACVNTGRRFVGIERDPDYFAIAERRIAEAQQATPLFLPQEVEY
jgi:site-specific DNA-methyltransferase (adenine-specific)